MSVILALCDPARGATWIGSDTMAMSGSLRLDCGAKWILQDGWAAGIAGYLRSANLLEADKARLLAGLAGPGDFVDRARALFRADGYREETDEHGPPNLGQAMLLATAGRAWMIGGDFSVADVPPGLLWAEGSGRELAIGAGHALARLPAPPRPEEIARRALEAALALDTTCGGALWLAELAATPAPGRGGAARFRTPRSPSRSRRAIRPDG